MDANWLRMHPNDRINLNFSTALIIDDNAQSLNILCSVLSAFDLRQLDRAYSAEEAMELCLGRTYDLIVTDAQMPGVDGYDFVRWLRGNSSSAVRMTPAIIATAHTRRSEVLRARDCGANFIIAKPISPQVLLERIMWVGKASRAFIMARSYTGPDRRFRQIGPPQSHPDGRRDEDLETDRDLTPGERASTAAPQEALP